MYVTTHAEARIKRRLGTFLAPSKGIIELLERTPGEPGHVAYIVAYVPSVICDDGSNGDTVVAVAIDGSIETVFFRRSWNQSLGPEAFGVSRVYSLVRAPAEPRPEA